MKKKTKRKSIFFVILILFFCIYMFIGSIGYAAFSERLSINGVARTLEPYEGEALPVEPTVRPNGHYADLTDSGTSDLLTFRSESVSGDTLILNMKKSGLRWATRTNTFTVYFYNAAVLPLTNGTVTTTLAQNDSSILKSHNAALSTTQVGGQEHFQVVITITASWFVATGTQRVDTKITYNLEINGEIKPKTFNVIIYYS